MGLCLFLMYTGGKEGLVLGDTRGGDGVKQLKEWCLVMWGLLLGTGLLTHVTGSLS